MLVPLVWGCKPADQTTWRGYYYGDVFSNAAPLVKGPFANAGQCSTAMRALLRGAPTSASFSCARGCKATGNGSISTCREVAR